MESFLKEVLLAFMAACGFGYLNYYILDGLNVANINNDQIQEKKFTVFFFSSINVFICFVIHDKFNVGIYLSFVITFMISVLLSLFVYPFIKKVYTKVINEIRVNHFNLGKMDSTSIESTLFDRDKVLFAYVYDLTTDKLIVHGCFEYYDHRNNGFALTIEPFSGLEKISFDEAINKCENNEGVKVYINTNQNIKIVIIPEQD